MDTIQNIVQLFEVYKVKRKMWIITELCSGGDLTSRMEGMTEADVVIILEQILRAISYMHKRNVCHRDIKLENIMYENPDVTSPIKLIDFGLSNKFTKGEKMLKACGTVYTAAPELLLGTGYTEQTDIWSIGIVAWVMLSQAYPFMKALEEMNDEAKKEQLANAQYTFGKEWEDRKISKYGREFVANCLKKHPGARWFASEALEYVEDQWIPHLESLAPSLLDVENSCVSNNNSDSLDGSGQGGMETESGGSCNGDSADKTPSPKLCNPLERSVASTKKRTKMSSDVLEGLQNFADHSEIKKTILMTMAYTMDKSSLNELRDLFTVLDSKGTGTITLVDLKNALGKMHSDKHMDDKTIEKLFQGIDVDRSGQIHYNEFIAAVVESQGLITMEHLAVAFDRLDSSGKGYISKDDLRNMLGVDCDENMVNKMMDEADMKKNGQIDYDEFLRLMFEDITKGVDAVGRPDIGSNAVMTEKLGVIGPSRQVSFEELNKEEMEKPHIQNGDQ
uniref:Calmodulin n=1 Tax=Odontella aurita TaxID=265563 RepID=A0A6U6K7F4_9STRA|mmetsp:Transcript_6020/g.17587  ORF Transcript_6020/g.17587 Transcript_6020/m.17587 type:complete len:506 (+) Transcript_6020:715-2232(+)